ncbi:hypothetical protein BDW22DRAFT_1351415 [Trametopsis cervina]|nr:hypothetical protein BDW22DRAFT_1351415 [Trametopsis cervina]
MATEDQERLLRALEAHGQQFLASFDYPQLGSKRGANAEAGPSNLKKPRRDDEETNEDEDEWSGIGGGESDFDGEYDESAGEDSDADSLAASPTGTGGPQIIQFTELVNGAPSASNISKAHQKAFMSSKVIKLTQSILEDREGASLSGDDRDEELTNAQNDALLHRLVHTKLLSGSLKDDLGLTPAQRRKALAGRVLEAAGKAKLGKGETAVRSKERNTAAKHVRDGLVSKQKERNAKALEEAKHMGNYHPALKKLYDDQAESRGKGKRERGLRMGVGSFAGGVLKLSKNEIDSAAGKPRGGARGRGRGRGRGSGGRGGRGGGRGHSRGRGRGRE